MSDAQVYRSSDIPDLVAAPASPAAQRAVSDIVVESVDASRLTTIGPAWVDLCARADAPNAFMDPALVRIAENIDTGEEHRSLLAWKPHDRGQHLVGVWTVSISRARMSPLPLRVINTPPHVHNHLATPVIDRNHLDEALGALLDGIANDPHLPNIIAFDRLAIDGPTYAALDRVLAARGTAPCIFETFNRPKLQSGLDGKSYLEKALSSSTRKKLRQHRRRLAEKGALTFGIASAPQDVRAALEEFLAIEAAGWKGREGTALLCIDHAAAYMRGAIGALADAGCAAIHALRLDGKPVSMQIVVRAGRAAFTWKTTYDEQFRDFSPGVLLLEEYTAAFLADKSIEYVDSCALDETSFMTAWSERQAVADLWIDARRGGSLEFRALSRLQRAYRDLRAMAKAQYLAWRKSHKS